MHPSVLEWVEAHVDLVVAPVLEVGSYNVNGSVRHLCPVPYTGIDVVDGPGVDVVYDGGRIPYGDRAFPTVICTEVFEHAHRPWLLAAEIVRVLGAGGTAFVSARGNGFAFHNPPDRWRYMPGTLAELFTDLGCSAVEEPDPYPDHPGALVIVRAPCALWS